MRNLKNLLLILITLAAALSGPGVYGQSNQPQPSSAKSSKASGTDVKNEATFVNACAAAADELSGSRLLISALEEENAALRNRLEIETQISSHLAEAKESREAETAALHLALTAKDETIAAKDAVIDNRERVIAELKKKSRSPIKRITDILVGAAIFAIIK